MATQRDFDDSTLWRISAYERMRAETGESGFSSLDSTASARVLPTTLHADMRELEQQRRSSDALDTIAVCVRHQESALVLLRHGGLVWPLTLFPRQQLYHLPRCMLDSLPTGKRDLAVIAVEPPGVRPPGRAVYGGADDGPAYRPLSPLLWAVALHAPRARLLDEIGGRAAYRLSADLGQPMPVQAGALGPALQRLRSEVASLQEIASWPGMDSERATRLLNAVYLQGSLIVLRTHPAARWAEAADSNRGTRSWFRPWG